MVLIAKTRRSGYSFGMKPLYDQNPNSRFELKENYNAVPDKEGEGSGAIAGLFLIAAPLLFVAAVIGFLCAIFG